jgi:hypothetical protein
MTKDLSSDKKFKPKKTSIGSSVNTKISSKNDKRNKKPYRGQGR